MLMLGYVELKIRLGHVKILRSRDIGWVRFSRGGSVGVQNRAGLDTLAPGNVYGSVLKTWRKKMLPKISTA